MTAEHEICRCGRCVPPNMRCYYLRCDEQKCAKRVTTHSPGIPLKSNSRVPQPVLCRNLSVYVDGRVRPLARTRRAAKRQARTWRAAKRQSGARASPLVPPDAERARSWHRRSARKGSTSTPLRVEPSTSGAKRAPLEPTWARKRTFRKRPLAKPRKILRVARSLYYFSHENFFDSEKTPFSTPSRKGPGPTFGAPACLDRRAGTTCRQLFRARAHFRPKRAKYQKVHF